MNEVVKLFNAFSLQMLNDMNATVKYETIENRDVIALLANGFVSYIGHEDTANVIGNMLGLNVPFVREFGKINSGDVAIIAQVVGGRLPIGTTVLPEGMNIVFIKVTIV